MEWKDSSRRKPLILRGARQVGKTHLIVEFGKQEFENIAHFNFEKTPALNELFQGTIHPPSILEKLSLYAEKKIVPGKTLVFFDEVQASPAALTSLKYFNEERNDLHLVAAGSLLGIKIGNSAPFPVGKVNFLDLHPFSFLEFLDGIGKSGLRSHLESIQEFSAIEAPFHEALTEALRMYFFVGGMPEAIVEYQRTRDHATVREVQLELLRGYENDFAKYASASDALKIQAIWDSASLQLAKERKKFKFSEVHKNARARDYETALSWLVDAGLVRLSKRISAPALPLAAQVREGMFKTYLLDTGLLGAKLNLAPRTVVDGYTLFSQFNGAFTENFVAQELAAYGRAPLFYWSSPSDAEVDFIVPHDDEILPLEVKAGLNARLNSLRSYAQKYGTQPLCVASMRNLRMDGNVHNFPLYALCLFPRLIAKYV